MWRLQFVAIRIQLRFGNAKVRVIRGVAVCSAWLGSLRGRGQVVYGFLILGYELLELVYFLRERQRIAGEITLLGLKIRLAQRGRKCLIDRMVGEALGLSRIVFLFRRGGHARESLRRGPGTGVDQGSAPAGALHSGAGWPVRHDAASLPREYEAGDEKDGEAEKHDESRSGEGPLFGVS